MLEILKVIVLAVIQGIAEFLPVSSSGHLVVVGKLLNWDTETSVLLNVVLHAGTLVSIVIFYFRELLALLKVENRNVVKLILVGTIPAVIVGFGIKLSGVDKLLFDNTLVSGIGFLITATLLIVGMRGNSDREPLPLERMGCRRALLVGLAQAFAILPGVSRSGSTISVALKCGVSKADSARFSFMLAIPVIGGAALLKIVSALREGTVNVNAAELLPFVLGFLVSAMVGYVSLKLLLAVLQKGKLAIFSAYLYTVGIIVIIWSIAGMVA